MSTFDEEILVIFLDESAESLVAWEKCCLQLGENVAQNDDAISQLFRCAHNMKGSAKSVGLAALGQFIHAVEEVILKLKNKVVEPTQSVTLVLLQCQDLLSHWLSGLRTNPSFLPETGQYVASLNALRPFDASANVAAFSGNAISEIQNAKEGDIVFILEDVSQPQIKSTSETGSVTLPNPVSVKSPAPEKNLNESIRVPAARIDSLIQLVGELSIQASIISHAKVAQSLQSTVALDAIDLLNKITRELQTRSLGFRMQTLQGTMQRLERVARDVAGELGKEIEVVTEGADVELDKTVLERMTDPLVHMIRNALDHGIETTEERAATNKHKRARVSLEARQAPDGVTLLLRDDGRGLNAEKILAKAQSQGLVGKDQQLSQQEIFSLIFHQGFSTAEKVTGISGRGVGMEVVQRAVSDLGGQISIESNLGVGTCFSISLPSSVSIIDALLVHISNSRYAIPLAQVDEILSSRDLIFEKSVNNQVLFNLRDEYLPFQDLRTFMSEKINPLAPSSRAPHDTTPSNATILVVRHLDRRIGFAVDAISGQQQVVVRKLSGVLETLDGFVGGTILGDGEPGFIMDIPYWASEFFQNNKGAI